MDRLTDWQTDRLPDGQRWLTLFGMHTCCNNHTRAVYNKSLYAWSAFQRVHMVRTDRWTTDWKMDRLKDRRTDRQTDWQKWLLIPALTCADGATSTTMAVHSYVAWMVGNLTQPSGLIQRSSWQEWLPDIVIQLANWPASGYLPPVNQTNLVCNGEIQVITWVGRFGTQNISFITVIDQYKLCINYGTPLCH